LHCVFVVRSVIDGICSVIEGNEDGDIYANAEEFSIHSSFSLRIDCSRNLLYLAVVLEPIAFVILQCFCRYIASVPFEACGTKEDISGEKACIKGKQWRPRTIRRI